jgi:predicted nucleic acid-binding protein
VMPLTEQAAHAAGQLLGCVETSDIADAAVAQAAADRNAEVVTSDPDDIKRLLQAVRPASQIITV